MKLFYLSFVVLMSMIFVHGVFVSSDDCGCFEKASAYGDEIAENTGSQMEGNSAFYSYLLSCQEDCTGATYVTLDPVYIEG